MIGQRKNWSAVVKQWLVAITLAILLPFIVLCIVAVKLTVKTCILCWLLAVAISEPAATKIEPAKQPDDNRGDS